MVAAAITTVFAGLSMVWSPIVAENSSKRLDSSPRLPVLDCVWNCVSRDLATWNQLHDIGRKARVVNFTITIRRQRNSDCIPLALSLNSTNRSTTHMHLTWALREDEPYMNLPSDFLRFSNALSPYLSERMSIRMDCQQREVQGQKFSGRRKLRNAAADTVLTLLKRMEILSAGILCSLPQPAGIITRGRYECVFQSTYSGFEATMQWSIVQFSEFKDTFNTIDKLWCYIGVPLLVLYFPTVVCLFPYRKKSKDGADCIVLADPSPRGFRTFLYNFIVPQSMESWLDKLWFNFLRCIIIVSCFVTPIAIYYGLVLGVRISVWFIVYYSNFIAPLLVLQFIFGVTAEKSPNQRPCNICHLLEPKTISHELFMADRIKVHLNLMPSLLKHYKQELLSQCSECRSRYCSRWQNCGSILLAILKCLLCFLYCSPLLNCDLISREMDYLLESCKRPNNSRRIMALMIFLVVVICYYIGLIGLSTFFAGKILLYSCLVFIADPSQFPFFALGVCILHCLYSCVSAYSEKYQLLKMALYELMRQKEEGRDSSLILYTKSEAIAIPEDLYEKACKVFSTSSFSGNICILILKMTGIIVGVVFVYYSVVMFGGRVGLSPLIQGMTIYVVASLPKLWHLFSVEETRRGLKEKDIEGRLQNLISEYYAKNDLGAIDYSVEDQFDMLHATSV